LAQFLAVRIGVGQQGWPNGRGKADFLEQWHGAVSNGHRYPWPHGLDRRHWFG